MKNKVYSLKLALFPSLKQPESYTIYKYQKIIIHGHIQFQPHLWHAAHTWKIHPVSLRRTCCKYNKTSPNAHAAAAKEWGGGVQIARNNFFLFMHAERRGASSTQQHRGWNERRCIYSEKKHIRITAALKAQKAWADRAPAVGESTPISLSACTAREEILRRWQD
jgi:hypothetical protein